MTFKNKKILIFGFKKSGLESALFFLNQKASLIITDLSSEEELKDNIEKLKNYENVTYKLGFHDMDDFKEVDLILKSPGINRINNKYLMFAQKNNVAIETDISIFLSLIPNKVIAVTGSKGKSTLCAMLAKCFNSFLGGNIGRSPISFLKDCLIEPDKAIILELSSFQLGDLALTANFKKGLHVDIAIITNILNDHQNYYYDMLSYINDKKVIYKISDKAIFLDDEYGELFKKEVKDYLLISKEKKQDSICIDKDKIFFKNEEIYDLKNDYFYDKNKILFTIATFYYYYDNRDFKYISSIIDTLKNFNTIPYRKEYIRTIEIGDLKIDVYNDSCSTIPDSTLYSIESFDENIYLICGGQDKNLLIDNFDLCFKKVKKIALLKGSLTEKILKRQKDNSKIINVFSSLESAYKNLINEIKKNNESKAILLFSPGAASFNMFRDEFDRGQTFNKIVMDE